jgi:hypothetical protein
MILETPFPTSNIPAGVFTYTHGVPEQSLVVTLLGTSKALADHVAAEIAALNHQDSVAVVETPSVAQFCDAQGHCTQV